MKSIIVSLILLSGTFAQAYTYSVYKDSLKPVLKSGKYIQIDNESTVKLDVNGYQQEYIVKDLSTSGIIETYCKPETVQKADNSVACFVK